MTKRKQPPTPKKGPTMTPRKRAFCEAYAVEPNATTAAKAAGFSHKTAYAQGSRLLKDVQVAAYLAALRAESAKLAQIDGAEVLTRLAEIANADPNELAHVRRRCCRHCYGKGNEYQWTEREHKRALELYPKKRSEWEHRTPEWQAKHATEEPEFPENLGGMGFDPRLDPNPNCPECFGDGIEQLFIADTRKLKPEARRAFAGVEMTKDGIRLKMHDRAAALIKIGENAGLFVKKIELSGKVEIADRLKEARERVARR